ncbi:hypothetical protein Nepgr_021281 [Nepenthes gracilis]|uniref:FCP1 homology domain-containing protein n=1 Tax=Nepenthes gracilis TaxID=150966 RepID=A0AAD3XX28_NEPGR|nr:hypothetical protein Nepgr_021281 [Nepenthes gracilis]
MVSKIIKKTPTKSLKECRRSHRRKKTPLTPKSNISAASSVVIAAINESLFSCHRRLVKIFSKLVCMSTPNKKSPKRQGFQKLIKSPIPEEQEQAIRFQIPPKNVRKPLFFGLPPLTEPHTKTIFLDLDETLIHSKPEPPPEKYDFVVRPTIDGEMINFYVLKRPGVDEFLEFLSERFEIVVFTAGLKEYASLVLDALDRNGVISHRLYRDSCREMEGKFVKDLSEMGRDLMRVVIVDDNPSSYVFQPENAIPVRPFVDDLGDRELLRLMEFLDLLDGFDDIREAVKLFDSPRQP